MSWLTKIKEKLSKTFFRKDKNYFNGIAVGVLVATLMVIIYCSNGFYDLETYLQVLIFQYGYKVPDNVSEVTIVKKDQTTSSLINKDPGRREYASMINFLGSSQTREKMYKSRVQKYELFKLEFGFYKNIRNALPISTSYSEWAGLVTSDEENNGDIDSFPNQDLWKGTSRVITEYFKKPENIEKPGYTSFIKFTGKTWLPRGKNLFKNLAGGNDYLIIPTLFTNWNDKGIIKEIESSIGLEEDNTLKFSKDNKTKQSPAVVVERWCNFYENLVFADINYDIKLFPKKKNDSDSELDKTWFSLSLSINAHPRNTGVEVKPISVIGFDFVLQGEKNREDDLKLIEALQKINGKVVLAAHGKTEVIVDEGAVDEKSFTQVFDTESSAQGVSKIELNRIDDRKEISEDVLIKPSEYFLSNKANVDYAMIDMSAGNKSFVTEVPIIVRVNEDVYENGVLIATQTIKPSFALRIALEQMDFKNNKELNEKINDLQKNLNSLKEDSANYSAEKAEYEKSIEELNNKLTEPGYVATQQKVFKEIRKSFCEGTFTGNLTIKDLELPLNYLGRLFLNYTGTTRKGSQSKAAINSVSLFECLEDDLLKEHLKNNPKNTRLSPVFAHRRVLGANNKSEKVFLFGPFESTDFDFYPTPISFYTPFQISKEPLMGVEIHANTVLSILNRKFLKYPNQWVLLASIVGLSLFCGLVFEMVSPFVGAFLAILLIYATSCYSYFSYHSLGQVFHFAPLITAIILVWLGSILINYIKQRKKAQSTKDMFSKFVSADVVKYMLDNPDLVRPGGTKTELTIFFSDVAGFTTISEGLSPEDLVVLLNEYLGAMTDLLFEYGGTLDKFIGDAVMAFWNFPKKQEDHAVKAVLCAIAMQKKIKELQMDWAKRGFPKVAARCGINTQDVVVGYMGSQKAQMNFTCMGDGVNLASRLEGANKEYGTMMMVSDNTYQRVKHAVRGRFLDFLAVKGKKEPVKVHELVCKVGDEPEGWFERTALYDKAIQLHLERKWDEAIATFEEVLKLDPDDGPSKTYITRCNEYKVNPPPEGWDGRYILTHK